MQALARTSEGGTAYTTAQVIAAIQAAVVREEWKFYRVSSDGSRVLGDISGYLDRNSVPEVTFDATATIMRTLKIPRILGNVPLDPYTEMIEPHYRLYMPDLTVVDWAMGRFTLDPGERQVTPGGTYLALDGYDFGKLLTDQTLTVAYSALAGRSYVSAVIAAVGQFTTFAIPVYIVDNGQVLPASMAWEAGTPLWKVIRDLLQAGGYEPPWFDEIGRLCSAPLIDFTMLQPSFTFDATSGHTVIKSPIRSKPELTNAFNYCKVIGEDPRRSLVSGDYTNVDPGSRVSTANWYLKTKVIKDSKMASNEACRARAKSEVQAAARVYEPLTILTMPWAFSQYRDVYQVIYATADEGTVDYFYVSEKWTHRCAAGQNSEHRFVRIVAS